MKTKTKKILLIFISLILLSFQIKDDGKLTIYLIGDSTIAQKKTENLPETGWGTPYSIFFDSTVIVDNRAKNGRSTKSFLEEGLWKPVYENLKKGDYVLIQFGHNDEVESKIGRYTTPDEFRNNLAQYVIETQEKKAIPVLITPVTRRQFDENGRAKETHPVYSNIVMDVAKQQNVPLIDLDLLSRELLNEFGPEYSKLLYLHLASGEHPNYPGGKENNTHFSELGARKMAQIVLREIKNQELDLSNRIVNHAK